MIRLFRVSIPSSVLALFVLETILLARLLHHSRAFRTRRRYKFYLFYDGGWRPIVLVVATIQLGLYFQDLYDHLRPVSRIYLGQQVSLVLGGAFLLQAVLGYGRSTLELNKWTMVYGSLLVLLVLPVWRVAFFSVISKALPPEKLLFLGASATLRGIAMRLSERPELGSVVVGYLSAAPDELPETPWLGDMQHLQEVVQQHRPSRIVVGLADSRKRLPMQQLLDLRFSGIQIEEATAAFESVFGRVSIPDLRPSQLIFSGEMGPRRWMVQLQGIYSEVLGLDWNAGHVAGDGGGRTGGEVVIARSGHCFDRLAWVYMESLLCCTNSVRCTRTRRRAPEPYGQPRTIPASRRRAAGCAA